jgi:predicted ATP-dependent serine protease
MPNLWIPKCKMDGKVSKLWSLGKFLASKEEARKFIKTTSNQTTSQAVSITDIKEEELDRFSSNDSELDLVLGGGIVKRSLTLIGGSPGVLEHMVDTILYFEGDSNKELRLLKGFKRAIVPKKPIEKSKIKCFKISEVSNNRKLIKWM